MSLEIVDLCAAGCGRPGDEHSLRGKPWCGDQKCYHEIGRIIMRERREDAAATDDDIGHGHRHRVTAPVRDIAAYAELKQILQEIRLTAKTVGCEQWQQLDALAIRALTVIEGCQR